MRPVPQSRHLLAVLFFAGVSAVTGYLASVEDRLTPTQVSIAAAAVKRQDPATFRHDPIFGNPKRKLWLFHTPAFQSLMELALVPTGYQNLRLPFRAMAGVMTMVFLCGMYALLYAQCRSWSVAAFVAVLSSRVIETLGDGVWGVGSLGSIAPAGLCLAVFPLVVLAFGRYSEPRPEDPFSRHWRLFLVFGVVGLLGNLHLVTAMNMTLVLLIAYVVRQRFSPRCLPIAIGCGLCALVAASPFIGYYFGVRATMSQGEPDTSLRAIHEAIEAVRLTVLYPGLLKRFLHGRMLAGALLLVVLPVVVLGRVERYRTRHVRMWVALLAASLFVSLVLHGVSQLVGCAMNAAPPVIDFPEAASLALLPLYVLLAQAITNVFRLLRMHRKLLRWACTALVALWMIPSDNLRVARHGAADLATAFMDEEDKPAYVLRHAEKRAERRELAAIGHWAAARDRSIYLTSEGEFRVLARRAILAAPEDARYLYYLTPGRLEGWLGLYRQQQKVLFPAAGRADARAVQQFVADQIERSEEKEALAQWEWYVILEAGRAPEQPDPLQPIDSEAWGEHYRLYRVR